MANDHQQEVSAGAGSVRTTTDATAVVRFGIGGLLRFLSHAETLRVFERACVRSRVPVKYTQGFNPHPKLSLPLPRPVGVASDDELLVLRLYAAEGFPLGEGQEADRRRWQNRTKAALAAELPTDIVIGAVTLKPSNASFHPESTQYVFAVGRVGGCEIAGDLRDRGVGLLASESLVLERMSPKRGTRRRVDVRPFLKSIRFEDSGAVVECGISDAGSVRVDEIMTLLQVEPRDLVSPIRRTNTLWKIS